MIKKVHKIEKKYIIVSIIAINLFIKTLSVSANLENSSPNNNNNNNNNLYDAQPTYYTAIEKVSKAVQSYEKIRAPIVNISEKNNSPFLKWDSVKDAKYYNIKRGFRPGELREVASNITDLEFIDIKAEINDTYYYSVIAVDQFNQKSLNSNIVIRMTAPKVPVLFGGWENDGVRLSWSHQDDCQVYNLYRGTKPKGPYEILTQTLDNQYIDKEVDLNSEYYYVVRSVNSVGESGNSYELKVTKQSTYNMNFVPYADNDIDELTNEEELILGTDMNNWDTDGDGLSDGYEIHTVKSNPSNKDTDSDGIIDGAEFTLGTDPQKKNMMQKINKFSKSADKKVEIISTGNNNIIGMPSLIIPSKNILLNSIPGMLGKPQDVFVPNQTGTINTLVFHYEDLDLVDINEKDLSIYKLDNVNKKIISLNEVKLEPESNMVSVVLKESGVYFLGVKGISNSFDKLDVLFVIDNLSFINGKEYENKRLDIINNFLEGVKDPGIRFGLHVFSDEKQIKHNFSSDKKAIINEFENIRLPKTTVLSSNITEELSKISQFFEENKLNGKMVILFSGVKNSGDNHKAIEIAGSIAKKNIKLFTVGFGKNSDRELLRNIAMTTGGNYFELDNEGLLKQNDVTTGLRYIFNNISESFKPMYAMTKQSKNVNIFSSKENTVFMAERISDAQNKTGFDFSIAKNIESPEGCYTENGNLSYKEKDIKLGDNGLVLEHYYNSNAVDEAYTKVGFGWRIGYDSSLRNVSQLCVVNANSAEIRMGPNIEEKIIAMVMKGEVFKLVKNDVNNVLIEMKNGQRGYINAKNVQVINSGIEVLYGSGTRLIFEAKGNEFISPSGCTDTLTSSKDGYLLTRNDKTVYQYEKLPNGKLYAIKDTRVGTIYIKYTSEQIASVILKDSELKFLYKSDKTLDKIIDNKGFSINYQYDENGTLKGFQTINGKGNTYEYEQNGKRFLLKKVKDKNNSEIIINTYDKLGRLVSNTDGNGVGLYVSYNILSDSGEGIVKYPYDAKGDMNKSVIGLGVLSEKYESRGSGGAACIANNPQDSGGKSYGAWQLASSTGSVDSFLKWMRDEQVTENSVHRSVYKRLSDAKALDKGYGSNFDIAWKEIASSNYMEFLEIQSSYIKLKYYDKANVGLKNIFGFDIDKRSRALKSVLFSTSVQHGPGLVNENTANTYIGAVPIFRKALEKCLNLSEGTLNKVKRGTYDFSKISDEKIINEIYNERSRLVTFDQMKEIVVRDWGRQDASKVYPIVGIKSLIAKDIAASYGIEGQVMYHFCGNGPDVQTGVYIRLGVNEKADALRMLRNPGILP
jgi:fibronectin type 3 domain-containing protein